MNLELQVTFISFQIPRAIKDHYVNPPSLLPRVTEPLCSSIGEQTIPCQERLSEITPEEEEDVSLALWCLMPLSAIFQLYHGVSFIGGGNRSTGRKPQTCRKSQAKFITLMLYRAHLAIIGVRTYNFCGDKH